tara:strand:+ start:100 stop:762 length:663 start_codon:yes stop_codon:yes gene_type:complete
MKYWGDNEEQAIVMFNTTENVEDKHVVYTNTIEPAFKQLVENIYYTFNFNRTLYDFNTIQHEATTHLYEKLSKFDVSKNKKSYSYFGTIVKNWLIQQSTSYKKRVFIDGDNNDVVIYDLSINHFEEQKTVKSNISFIDELKEQLLSIIKNNDEKLTQDDIEVLSIIVEVLKEYDKLYITNKKQLYVYIRESTDLPSRKITKSLNKIKSLYKNIKLGFIEA